MAVLNVIIMTVIYYPFFKMMEADELKKEAEQKTIQLERIQE